MKYYKGDLQPAINVFAWFVVAVISLVLKDDTVFAIAVLGMTIWNTAKWVKDEIIKAFKNEKDELE